MKVVAINSSPMMGKGSTALILKPFLEGMEKAGAEVQLFYTKKLDIRPCQGDFHCWTRHPGECFQTDDMRICGKLMCGFSPRPSLWTACRVP